MDEARLLLNTQILIALLWMRPNERTDFRKGLYDEWKNRSRWEALNHSASPHKKWWRATVNTLFGFIDPSGIKAKCTFVWTLKVTKTATDWESLPVKHPKKPHNRVGSLKLEGLLVRGSIKYNLMWSGLATFGYVAWPYQFLYHTVWERTIGFVGKLTFDRTIFINQLIPILEGGYYGKCT